jgi:hypothetical protein
LHFFFFHLLAIGLRYSQSPFSRTQISGITFFFFAYLSVL